MRNLNTILYRRSYQCHPLLSQAQAMVHRGSSTLV
uniref:Uncharacterized protein n=1 Tax=Arundo donax TaxID=35708 RepID=A0A0A9H800_ARUDO